MNIGRTTRNAGTVGTEGVAADGLAAIPRSALPERGLHARFLIDTPAMRNASKPLKSNGKTFSNRHRLAGPIEGGHRPEFSATSHKSRPTNSRSGPRTGIPALGCHAMP